MSNRLNETDALEIGDQFVLYKGGCTDFRAVPTSTVLAWILENIPVITPASGIIQLFNPTADFTIEITNNPVSTYLVMNPLTGITNGTIKLPPLTRLVDGQEVLVTSSQQISNLTIDGNGAALIGDPNALSASGFFTMKFEKVSQTWYRRG
ncbi:TPA: transcriptional regulator [Acinetobacter baumannii]|nr:transcriptional regulator [Acinetobacter baumannii]